MINAKEVKKGNYVIHEGEPYIISSIFTTAEEIRLTLQSLFSDDSKELILMDDMGLEEADITRKTASVLFKKKGKLEIMDSYNFAVYDVSADKEMFENAVEGDMVTYIKFRDSVRILELRKD